MALYGLTWFYMDLHGFIWIYMDLHGFTWIYMDLPKTIQNPSKSSNINQTAIQNPSKIHQNPTKIHQTAIQYLSRIYHPSKANQTPPAAI